MYFAIMQLRFEANTLESADDKDLRQLADRVRTRFKVASSGVSVAEAGQVQLVVAALSRGKQRLSQKLDSIIDFCESSGFGRVESETTLMDHIDNLEDWEEV